MFPQNAASNSAIFNNSVYHEEEVEVQGKMLPNGFVPGPMDVICSRGKSSFKHPGNCHYRKIIKSNLLQYSTAKAKADKSLIVSCIVNSIRESSSSGIGFVKLMKDGRWYEVGEHIVREKIGQSFRDLLHNKYSSSSKAKQLRRKKKENSKSLNSARMRNSIERGIPPFTNCEDVYEPLPIKEAPFYALPMVSHASSFSVPEDSNPCYRELIDVMDRVVSGNEKKNINVALHGEEAIGSIVLQPPVSLSSEPIPIGLAASMSDYFYNQSMSGRENLVGLIASLTDRQENTTSYQSRCSFTDKTQQ